MAPFPYQKQSLHTTVSNFIATSVYFHNRSRVDAIRKWEKRDNLKTAQSGHIKKCGTQKTELPFLESVKKKESGREARQSWTEANATLTDNEKILQKMNSMTASCCNCTQTLAKENGICFEINYSKGFCSADIYVDDEW